MSQEAHQDPAQLHDRQDRHGPLVAFDVDGTVTTKDSFVAFLRWRAGPARFAAGLLRLAPAGISYGLNPDRGRFKAAAIKEFLAGTPREALIEDARRFATHAAPELLRPDAVTVWRRHQKNGGRVVVVTASPDLLVEPFAHGLGAELVIGTRLKFDSQDRVEGGLVGANCRGPEKVRRFQEIYGQDVRPIAAYGDSDGDKELVDYAETGFMRYFTGAPIKSRF